MHRKNNSGNREVIAYRFGELFCGPGGIALGALKASVRADGCVYKVKHAWANDIDSDSCSTYRRNICPEDLSSVVCAPVEEVNFRDLPEIDALAFGFPCNDFSIVGERKGINGRYGPLYTYGAKALNYFKPKWFFAENVSGLKNIDKGRAFERILSDFKSAGNGYNLTTHLYKFEDYGVPQCRHRIIIIGIEQSLGVIFRVPAPTTPGRPKTAKEALEDPPILKNSPNNELTRQSETVAERLKHIPPGGNAWQSDLAENLRLNVKGAKLSQIYRRLHPGKPAYTVTGSGGGGTHGYHWAEPRALTNRERARLQTFPDDFVFEGSKESVRRQIGMAVPPSGAQIIIEAVLKTLAGINYKSVPAHWPHKSPQKELFSCALSTGRS